MKDLPLEVIKAISILESYLNDNGYGYIQISYLAVVKLFSKIDDVSQIVTPIALDMMRMRQQND